MKVWMLQCWREGAPCETKLFREEHPPSIDKIKEVLESWECDGYYGDLDKALQEIKETSKSHNPYELIDLTLEEVL